MSIDWADEKAREWLTAVRLDSGASIDPVWLDTTTAGTSFVADLAALMREVAAWETERDVALGQARRVVEEELSAEHRPWATFDRRDAILSRLKNL